MSRVIRARYEKGVLKPLDKIDLEEGEEVVISIKRDVRSVLRKYKGVLGKTSLEELLRLEEGPRPMSGLVYVDTALY